LGCINENMCINVARMFVQCTKCKHGSVTYFTYLVRESFRTPKGPRSRTICNITALPPETPRAHQPVPSGTQLCGCRVAATERNLELRRADGPAPGLGRVWLEHDL